jgi:hypothetical protein
MSFLYKLKQVNTSLVKITKIGLATVGSFVMTFSSLSLPALAAPICPSGYNWNGSQCEQRTPKISSTVYTCWDNTTNSTGCQNTNGIHERGIFGTTPNFTSNGAYLGNKPIVTIKPDGCPSGYTPIIGENSTPINHLLCATDAYGGYDGTAPANNRLLHSGNTTLYSCGSGYTNALFGNAGTGPLPTLRLCIKSDQTNVIDAATVASYNSKTATVVVRNTQSGELCPAGYNASFRGRFNESDPATQLDTTLCFAGSASKSEVTTTSCPAGYQDGGTNCFRVVAPTSNTPEGFLDTVDGSGNASGWVTDADAINQPTNVHFYIDGPAGTGTMIGQTVTSLLRADLPAPYNTGNNGYTFKIPSQYCNSQPRTLYAYGIDPQNVSNPLLQGSPKTFTLTPQNCGVPTTITSSNLNATGANCVAATIGSLTSCAYPLTGDPNNNYVLPATPVTVTVPGSTVSPGCTITGNGTANATLTCSNVPTTGSSAGTVQVPTSLGSTPTAPLTLTVGVKSLNPATDLGIGDCNNKSYVFDTYFTCTFPITGTGTYTLPTGGLFAETGYSGELPESSCTITGTNLVCTNIRAKNNREGKPNGSPYPTYQYGQVGIWVGQTAGAGNQPGYTEKAKITITKAPATAQQLTDAIDCTPKTTAANTTVKCTGQLPATVTADNLQVKVGTDGTTVTCTVSASGAIDCPLANVGTTTGSKDVNATTATVTTPVKVDTITVTAIPPTTITTTNLKTGTCTTATIGAVTSCTYPLQGDANNNYALPTAPITVTVPGSTVSPACIITGNGTTGAALTCSNVPTTGASAGTVQVPTSLGATPTSSLVLTTVPPTTITSANLNPTGASCAAVTIGSLTSCTYPLQGDANNNYALPTAPITVTVPGSTVSPACIITGNGTTGAKLVCSNVPTTGASAGTVQVPTSLGSTPTAPLTLTVGVKSLNPDTDLGTGDCNNKSYVFDTYFTCTFPITGTGTYTLPTGGLFAETGYSGMVPESVCTITGTNLVCTNIRAKNNRENRPEGFNNGSNAPTYQYGQVGIWVGQTAGAGNQPGYTEKAKITITKAPATAQQLTDAIDCTPKTTTVNTTVKCTGQLPATVTADNLQIKVGDGTAVTCTVSATGAIDCPLANVGTTTGTKDVTATTTTVTTPVKVDTITVTAAAKVLNPATDLGTGDCNNKSYVFDTYFTCTFPITGTGTYTLPTGGLFAETGYSGQLPESKCVINGMNLVCTNIRAKNNRENRPEGFNNGSNAPTYQYGQVGIWVGQPDTLGTAGYTEKAKITITAPETNPLVKVNTLIRDPYQCGGNITGDVTYTGDYKLIKIKVTLTKVNETTPKYTFDTTINEKGEYTIVIDYSKIAMDKYIVNYEAINDKNQVLAGGSYTADITNKCEKAADTKTVRSGGTLSTSIIFAVTTLLIIAYRSQVLSFKKNRA